MSLGIWIADWLLRTEGTAGAANAHAWTLFAIGAGLSVASGLLAWTFARVLLTCCVIVLTCAWTIVRLGDAPPDALSRVLAAQGDESLVRLTLTESPRRTAAGPGSEHPTWIAIARVREVVTDNARTPASGAVWLRIRGDASRWRGGDRVIVQGTLRPIARPDIPGVFDLYRWARDRRIEGSLHIYSPGAIRPDEARVGTLERAESLRLRWIDRLRARAMAVLDHATASSQDDDARQVLRGLLLGQDRSSPGDAQRAFYTLGLAHILSISGFHLGVFAWFVLLGLRLMGDLGRLEPLLVALAVLLFLTLVPADAPVMRAGAIALAMLLAEVIGRRYDRLTILMWTAAGLLLLHPSDLWSLGFQLSFAMTGVLIALAPRLQTRLFPPRLGLGGHRDGARARLREATQSLISVSLACWLISSPWLAASVGIFNPAAVLTAVVFTPLITLILALGYAVLLAGLVLPISAAWTGPLLATLTSWCVELVVACESIPVAALRLPPLSMAWGAAGAVCMTLLLSGALGTRGRPVLCALVVVWIAWGASEWNAARALPPPGLARVLLVDEAIPPTTLWRSQDRVELFEGGWVEGRARHSRDLVPLARASGGWRLDRLSLASLDPARLRGQLDAITILRPRVVDMPDDASRPELSAALREAATRAGSQVRVRRAGEAPPTIVTRRPDMPPGIIEAFVSVDAAGVVSPIDKPHAGVTDPAAWRSVRWR